VKCEIARPGIDEALAPNQVYTVCGAAWAGETDVVAIEVTADGGNTWQAARFLDPAHRYAWRRWTCEWRTPAKAGRYTVLARATAADGHVQPASHDPSYGSYAIHHALPIDVFVDDPGQDRVARRAE
jgi:hypothetical protein